MNDNEIISLIQQYQHAGNDISSIVNAAQSLMSTPKTPLGLNQWQPEDKPRMEHFNEDNRIIDEQIRELKEKLAKKVDKEGPLLWYNMVLETDYTGQIAYCKDSTGTVFVNGYIQKDTIPSSTETIFTLPAGFRPSRNSRFVLLAQSGRCTTGIAYSEDGRVTIMTPPPGWASTDAYAIDFSFKAGS